VVGDKYPKDYNELLVGYLFFSQYVLKGQVVQLYGDIADSFFPQLSLNLNNGISNICPK
jgi:hypothetical protein